MLLMIGGKGGCVAAFPLNNVVVKKAKNASAALIIKGKASDVVFSFPFSVLFNGL